MKSPGIRGGSRTMNASPDSSSRTQIKNMIDLCYQTLALADIDRDEVRRENREQRRAHPFAAAARRAVGHALRAGCSPKPNSRPGMRCGLCTRPAFRRIIRRWRRPSAICSDGSSRSAAGWIRCNPTKTSGLRSAKRRCRCWRLARTFPAHEHQKGWDTRSAGKARARSGGFAAGSR